MVVKWSGNGGEDGGGGSGGNGGGGETDVSSSPRVEESSISHDA